MLIRVLFRREEGGEVGGRRTFHFYKALQSTIYNLDLDKYTMTCKKATFDFIIYKITIRWYMYVHFLYSSLLRFLLRNLLYTTLLPTTLHPHRNTFKMNHVPQCTNVFDGTFYHVAVF